MGVMRPTSLLSRKIHLLSTCKYKFRNVLHPQLIARASTAAGAAAEPTSTTTTTTSSSSSSSSSSSTSSSSSSRTTSSTSRSTSGTSSSKAARGGLRSVDDSWPGLRAWRLARVDERVLWGPDRAAAEVPPHQQHQPSSAVGESLAECARQVLLTPDPREKASLTHSAWRAFKGGWLPVGTAEAPAESARPDKPELVPPKQIPSMKASPLPLNAYTLHNLAHIELNAIDLAWDTVARFSGLGLPDDFYADFARVADDEARHLLWCLQRLGEVGYEYGCMPAHNLLWEGGEMSSGDLLARLAIVPMSQEARGLDAGKRLAEKLVGWGDNRTAAIVHQIALEERNHVAVGVAWFQAISDALGVDPGPTFRSLLLELCPDLLKGPFNHDERGVAGLPRSWYDPTLWPQHEHQAAEARRRQGAAPQATAAEQQQQQQQQQRQPEGLQHAAQQEDRGCQCSDSAGSSGSLAVLGMPAGSLGLAPGLQQNDEQLQRLRHQLAAMLEIELRAT